MEGRTDASRHFRWAGHPTTSQGRPATCVDLCGSGCIVSNVCQLQRFRHFAERPTDCPTERLRRDTYRADTHWDTHRADTNRANTRFTDITGADTYGDDTNSRQRGRLAHTDGVRTTSAPHSHHCSDG